jgi:hypothetical protein
LLGSLALQAVLLFQAAFGPAAPAKTNANVPGKSRNPHGTLNLPCENCHTAKSKSWMEILESPKFEHRKTGFPLRGMHTHVACAECHADPVFANVGRQCQDCHADLHRRKNGTQCDMCHRDTGWQVSIHDINEHQDRFPLIGAHAAVDCYSCHTVGAIGAFNRQGLSTECVSCHLPAFRKAKSPNHVALGYSTDCQQCHMSMDGWLGATFSPGTLGARSRR